MRRRIILSRRCGVRTNRRCCVRSRRNCGGAGAGKESSAVAGNVWMSRVGECRCRSRLLSSRVLFCPFACCFALAVYSERETASKGAKQQAAIPLVSIPVAWRRTEITNLLVSARDVTGGCWRIHHRGHRRWPERIAGWGRDLEVSLHWPVRVPRSATVPASTVAAAAATGSGAAARAPMQAAANLDAETVTERAAESKRTAIVVRVTGGGRERHRNDEGRENLLHDCHSTEMGCPAASLTASGPFTGHTNIPQSLAGGHKKCGRISRMWSAAVKFGALAARLIQAAHREFRENVRVPLAA